MTRRIVSLYAFWGAVVLGSLLASYLHLAAWLRPWMPEGLEAASYGAALALDGLILAPIVARQIVGVEVKGWQLPVAQWTGLLASVYVNARWGIDTMDDARLVDIGVGAAIFPLVAWIAERAMHTCVQTSQAEDARLAAEAERRAAEAEAKAREDAERQAERERQLARRARRSRAAVAPEAGEPSAETAPDDAAPETGRRVTREMAVALWHELSARYGQDPATIAAKTGRPLRTIQNWRQWAQAAT